VVYGAQRRNVRSALGYAFLAAKLQWGVTGVTFSLPRVTVPFNRWLGTVG
jgi:hypothetical protein